MCFGDERSGLRIGPQVGLVPDTLGRSSRFAWTNGLDRHPILSVLTGTKNDILAVEPICEIPL